MANCYAIGICLKCCTEIKVDECEKCENLLIINEEKEIKCAICNNN